MKKVIVPKLVAWLFLTGVTFLIFLTVMRFVFFYRFRPDELEISKSLEVFLLGFQFDLRSVSIILLIPFLIGIIHLEFNSQKWLKWKSIFSMVALVMVMTLWIFLLKREIDLWHTLIFWLEIIFSVLLLGIFFLRNGNPFENPVSGKLFKGYFLLISFLVVLAYLMDIQFYDYLNQRLNSSIWNYTADAAISLKMVWQTYPVITLILVLIACTALLYGTSAYCFRKISKKKSKDAVIGKWIAYCAFAILLGIGIFGRIDLFPLRYSRALKWSDAFFFQDNFKGNLALNPIQSLLSTIFEGNSSYDLEKVKRYYPLVAHDLGVADPDSSRLNYLRYFQASNNSYHPNVVLVICESFAAYKSSMWGNPLNSTPFFSSLCEKGVFFNRCFTPGYGTSRGVWATITGIPDVEYPNTASQNPAFVDQQSIINAYHGYDKFYFVGGSSGFENIGGLFNNSIDNIRIYDETNFNDKRVNVWGISDKNLFLEANKLLKDQTKPFFAVIQTSGNHRPYTIPDEDLNEFKLENISQDTLEKYGFEDLEELNAFRYADFCMKKFMEAAQEEKYFNNTIFVFVGDHGNPGNTSFLFPKAWETDWLSWNHVPLLFYAPSLLAPEAIHKTVSQLDVLPSVTALAKISFVNSTLGRNLFDTTRSESSNTRFLYNPNTNAFGMVSDRYVYTYRLRGEVEDFRSSIDDFPLSDSTQVAAEKARLKNLAFGYYETAKYMLANNRKNR